MKFVIIIFLFRYLCPLLKHSIFLYHFHMKKIVLLFLFICGPAIAENTLANGLQLGIGVSATTGFNVIAGYYNPEISYKWLRHFGARIDFAATAPLKSAIDSAIDSYMRDGRDVGDGVKIDEGKLDAWHGAVLIDYYPFVGSWRLTGGIAWGGATLDSAIFGNAENAPTERFYFYLAGDHYYYNGNSFDGTAEIDWNYFGPYFGTGLDVQLGCGFNLFLDAGVIITNSPARIKIDVPQTQLYIYNKETQIWSPVEIPQLTADILRAEQDANRKLSELRIYPMIKLGFVYRF